MEIPREKKAEMTMMQLSIEDVHYFCVLLYFTLVTTVGYFEFVLSFRHTYSIYNSIVFEVVVRSLCVQTYI